MQRRVGAAVREAAHAQLQKEGITLTPAILAELTARSASGDPAETLAAGAVFIATVALFSDRRLKERVQLYGRSESGIPVYEFSYKGFSTRWRGTIAQDLVKTHPDAVSVSDNGYLMVNYRRIDVPFERLAS